METIPKLQVAEEFQFEDSIWKITKITGDNEFLAMYCYHIDASPSYTMYNDLIERGDWKTDQGLFEIVDNKLKCVQAPTGMFFLRTADPRYLRALGYTE